jgi:L-alanine-DL-glutamate epimerase-like enolase superfamily enzyme
MRIRSVEAIPVEASFAAIFGGADKVPPTLLAPAAHFRRIPRRGQVATLIRITSEDGAVGWGEAFGLPAPLAATAMVEAVLAPALTGTELGEPGAMLADLRAYFIALGQGAGPAMEALSGVDIALWDLRANRAGQPLAALLGATPGPVETYASPVGFQPTPEASAERARELLGEGFHALKIKVGRGVATDAAHVAAVRDAVGPGVALMCDANCGYTAADAIAAAHEFAGSGVAWLEEPVPPHDHAAMAAIRKATPIPIAGGENEFTVEACTRLAAAGAVDILQPNITRIGGVSGLLAVGALCARHGLRLAPHGVGTSVGVAAAVHACRAAEGFMTYEANRLVNPLRDTMGAQPMEVRDGRLVAADRPGHGGAPEPSQLARWRLARG